MERQGKALLVGAVLVVWTIVTPMVWRDLARRPTSMVRGPAWAWRLASANLLGSVAYVVVGRRRAPRSRP